MDARSPEVVRLRPDVFLKHRNRRTLCSWEVCSRPPSKANSARPARVRPEQPEQPEHSQIYTTPSARSTRISRTTENRRAKGQPLARKPRNTQPERNPCHLSISVLRPASSGWRFTTTTTATSSHRVRTELCSTGPDVYCSNGRNSQVAN